EVVELEADAQEDRLVAVALEVAARSGDHRLGREQAELAVRKVDDAPLALLEALGAVDAFHLRHGRLDRKPLRLEVVPYDEMIVWRSREDLLHLLDARRQAVALFARGLHDAERGVPNEDPLPVPLRLSTENVGFHLMLDHFQRWQVVAVIRIAEIGRPLQEYRSGGDPEP